MFSTYPDEWPGVGLFLLRVAIGIELMMRAASLLADWRDLKLAMAAIALLAVGGATLLLTGYLTRFGAILVALASGVGILFWSTAPGLDFFESRITAGLTGVIAVALVCLGPGAFSLDSRLFGHQEIVIPKPSSDK